LDILGSAQCIGRRRLAPLLVNSHRELAQPPWQRICGAEGGYDDSVTGGDLLMHSPTGRQHSVIEMRG
jgi:hypothetical protein